MAIRSVGAALRAARHLLEDGWHPHYSRRPEVTPDGDYRLVVCDWSHPEATEFSLPDALMRVTNGDAALVVEAEESLRMLVIPDLDAPVWTERIGRTKREVLGLLDVAIARADRTEAA